MAKTYIQDGDVINYTNGTGSAIASGATVKIGSLIGIALVDIADGATGSVMLEGVFTVPKLTGTAWTQGDPVFWDAGAGKFTKVALGNTFAGYAFVGALSGDATGVVKLFSAGDNPAAAIAAVVAAVATADGSDAGTTQALANQLKTTVNAILVSLKNAGLMSTT